MEKRFITVDAGDIHEAEREPYIAYVEPAKPEHVAELLAMPTGGDTEGRSEWVWLRLRDGTLALATFPQADTYELFSNGYGVAQF